MNVYEYTSYKGFLRALIKQFPKNGRGLSARLAEHLNLPATVVSQILGRDRHFTPDQAVEVAAFFGLDERSTDYFIMLVHLARAESKKLKTHYEQKLERLRLEAQNLRNLVKGREELTEADKARFYSNWYYAGVFHLSAIRGFQTVEAIADYYGLSRAKIGEVVSFLLESGLLVETDGELSPGIKSTHVSDKSEFVNNHRRNWRDKAREKFTKPGEKDIFMCAPVSMGKEDAERFRGELLKLIRSFSKLVEPSPSEKLQCLNIDWFEF